jgi:hypothetical protein
VADQLLPPPNESAWPSKPLYARDPVFWEDAGRLADALGPSGASGSPSGPDLCADVIRQLHEKPDGQEMADLLIFLEEWEWARQGMIEELSPARNEILSDRRPATPAGRLRTTPRASGDDPPTMTEVGGSGRHPQRASQR